MVTCITFFFDTLLALHCSFEFFLLGPLMLLIFLDPPEYLKQSQYACMEMETIYFRLPWVVVVVSLLGRLFERFRGGLLLFARLNQRCEIRLEECPPLLSVFFLRDITALWWFARSWSGFIRFWNRESESWKRLPIELTSWQSQGHR